MSKSTFPRAKAGPAGAPTSGRRTLLLIMLLFLVPVVLATGLYFGGWRPQGKSLHHGQLVQPAQPLNDVVLRRADGKETQLMSSLRGSWVLLTFSRLPCTQACQDNLYKMQQVRLTQGKDASRVRRAFIALANGGDGSSLENQYPGLIVFAGQPREVQAVARQLAGEAGEAQESIYIVDPLGNLVLRYRADTDPSDIRKDLTRLLRLSQIG